MSHQILETEPARAGFNLKEIFGLLLRTWPYLRPQLRHLITWISFILVIEGVFTIVLLVAFDLWGNKILIGEKLEPIQARVLRLDDSYVGEVAAGEEDGDKAVGQSDTPAATDQAVDTEPEPSEKAMLTREQRRAVRDRLLLLFVVAFIVLLSLGPITDYYRTWILQRINQFLRVTMIERAEHLSLRYHSHARTGDAIYRVYQDSATITSVVENVLMEPIVAVGQVLFSVVVICIFSPYLGMLFLAGTLPVLWLVAWYTPRLQGRSRRARATSSDLTSRIQEAFAAIRIVKANRAERIMGQRFDRDSTIALDAAFYLRVEVITMRTAVMILAGLMILMAQLLMAGWTIVGDKTFLAGAIALVGFTAWNLGAYNAAESRIGEFSGNGEHLIGLWGVVQDMTMGLDRAFFLLDLKPDVVDRADALPMPAPIREIAYHDLTFGYDAGQPVLKGVSLSARVGTVTAIVGESGTGKSTLMSLLLRLYDPDGGSIAINGTDIRDIRIDDLRANVAIALQQNVLFATSVAENIAYATQSTSRRAIEAAAGVACADGFIGEMAAGYDTELGERGGKLSAGQRQRLTIARAIVRDTPILILDEPTASLDAETEHRVLANLAEWGRERIVFLITHRLSTIRNADQIAFLENGAIAEFGDHDALMNTPNGRYRRFVEAEVIGDNAEDAGEVVHE